MITRAISAAILCAALLTGCMGTPAQRERDGSIDPVQACRQACNRAADICADQRSAKSTGPISAPQEYGMTAVCNTELRTCTSRCGGGG